MGVGEWIEMIHRAKISISGKFHHLLPLPKKNLGCMGQIPPADQGTSSKHIHSALFILLLV